MDESSIPSTPANSLGHFMSDTRECTSNDDTKSVIDLKIDQLHNELAHISYRKREALAKLKTLRGQRDCNHDFVLVRPKSFMHSYDLYVCTKCKFHDYRL